MHILHHTANLNVKNCVKVLFKDTCTFAKVSSTWVLDNTNSLIHYVATVQYSSIHKYYLVFGRRTVASGLDGNR